MAGGLYWQVTASVKQIARTSGTPRRRTPTSGRPLVGSASTAARACGWRSPRPRITGSRPISAPGTELARGWLRQLDTTRDDVFYGDDGTLTARAYGAWLRRNAVQYVALPDASLDYSSLAERRLILAEPPYLRLRWSAPHWRVYEVRDPAPLVEPLGGGAVEPRWVGHQGFALT